MNFKCEYADKGCNHASNCTKRFYVYEMKACGYRDYFLYLDQFWLEKYGHSAELILQQKLKVLE